MQNDISDNGLNLDLKARQLAEQFNETIPSYPEQNPLQHILLTGVTGYLGPYLLRDILRSTQSEVTCLIRAKDEAHATKRFLSSVKHLSIDEGLLLSRCHIVVGDLADPYFNLEPDVYHALSCSITAVFHTAAKTSYVESYSSLEQDNVMSTYHIALFSCRGKAKYIHHISTLGYFIGANNLQSKIVTQNDIQEPGLIYGGYNQTKWVSEQFLRLMAARGINVTQYRAGLIIGDSVTGWWNNKDIIGLMIQLFLRMKKIMVPQSNFGIICVDWCAEIIVSIAKQLPQKETHRVYNLVAPETIPIEKIINNLKAIMPDMEQLDMAEWHAALQEYCEAHPEDLINFIYDDLFVTKLDGKKSLMDFYLNNPYISYDLNEINTLLALLKIKLSPMTDLIIQKFLSHLSTN